MSEHLVAAAAARDERERDNTWRISISHVPRQTRTAPPATAVHPSTLSPPAAVATTSTGGHLLPRSPGGPSLPTGHIVSSVEENFDPSPALVADVGNVNELYEKGKFNVDRSPVSRVASSVRRKRVVHSTADFVGDSVPSAVPPPLQLSPHNAYPPPHVATRAFDARFQTPSSNPFAAAVPPCPNSAPSASLALSPLPSSPPHSSSTPVTPVAHDHTDASTFDHPLILLGSYPEDNIYLR